MTYTVGSLFSGIGGIDLAFQLAGFEIKYQVEIDEYCNRVLQRHWPDVHRMRDVCEVTADNTPAVDVLAGGFPCQDISSAGKGAGLSGERSGLWWEFHRIISETRPRVVLLENVAAIVSPGRGGTDVTAALAALGYVSAWGIISAADAGAAHKRERWWCVAYSVQPGSSPKQANRREEHAEPDSIGASGGAEVPRCLRECDGQAVADTDSQRRHEPQALKESDCYVNGQYTPCECRGGAIIHAPESGCEAVGNAHSFSIQGQRSVWLEVTDSRCGTRQPQGTGYHQSAQRTIECGLGRTNDGLPARLDVARPGQPQHAWEAQRTVPPGSVPNRANRLKALGNAVVPQVVYPLAVEIRRMLEELDQ